MCFLSRKSICTVSACSICAIPKMMTPPLCNSALRRADRLLLKFCCRELSPALDLMFGDTHAMLNDWRVCLRAGLPLSIKSAGCCVATWCAAAFCWNCSVWPDEKCKQANHVTQCGISSGLVIRLKPACIHSHLCPNCFNCHLLNKGISCAQVHVCVIPCVCFGMILSNL